MYDLLITSMDSEWSLRQSAKKCELTVLRVYAS